VEQLGDVAEQLHHHVAPAGPIDHLEHPGDNRIVLVARHDKAAGNNDLGMGGFVEAGLWPSTSATARSSPM
jgi:hypothetical protein